MAGQGQPVCFPCLPNFRSTSRQDCCHPIQPWLPGAELPTRCAALAPDFLVTSPGPESCLPHPVHAPLFSVFRGARKTQAPVAERAQAVGAGSGRPRHHRCCFSTYRWPSIKPERATKASAFKLTAPLSPILGLQPLARTSCCRTLPGPARMMGAPAR